MRPLPETRSRRLGDHSHQKVADIKRLINGFATHQVTTRSKAKISKVCKAKNLRKTGGTPTRNAGSGRSINGTGGSSRVNGLLQRSSAYCGRAGKDGRRGGDNNNKAVTTNGFGPAKTRQLVILSNHVNNGNFRSSAEGGGGGSQKKQEEEAMLAIKRADAAEKRAERLKKRRSALWVLNCEAESFLFGETAAEKHEVELPPLSTPPKKRRRMRTNELGTLLKESPILSSKLRSPPLVSPQQSEELLPGRTEKTAERNGVNPPVSPAKSKEGSGTSTETVVAAAATAASLKISCVKDELGTTVGSANSYRNTLLMEAPLYSNPECNLNSNSVRLQNILSSMEWRFSFEELPSDEAWYSTFERQEKRQSSVPVVPTVTASSMIPPVLLPYETKVFNNSRSPSKKKLSRLPRKSPRCHASTLAILSSLKRGRYHRNSMLGPQSPTTTTSTPANGVLPSSSSFSSSVTPICRDVGGPEEKSKRMYKKRCGGGGSSLRSPNLAVTIPSPTKTSCLPPVSPPSLSLCSPSLSPLSPTSSSASSPTSSRVKDLTATQYLWDSIQLLSDPYVIQILAEERSGSPMTTSAASKLSSSGSHSSTSQARATENDVRGVKSGSQMKEASSVLVAGTGAPTPGGLQLTSSNRSYNNHHVKISGNSFYSHVSSSNNNNNSSSNNFNHSSSSPDYNMHISLSFDSTRRPISISTSQPSKKNQCKSSSVSNNNSSSHNNNNNCNSIVNSFDSGSDVLNSELKLNLELSCGGVGDKGVNGLSSSFRSRKSSRKSPVVLVSDIFKSGALKVSSLSGTTSVTVQGANAVISHHHNSSSSTTSTTVVSNGNCDGSQNRGLSNSTTASTCKGGSREDLLFRVEGLPPLPAWPV